jgi:hypothetical protein
MGPGAGENLHDAPAAPGVLFEMPQPCYILLKDFSCTRLAHAGLVEGASRMQRPDFFFNCGARIGVRPGGTDPIVSDHWIIP